MPVRTTQVALHERVSLLHIKKSPKGRRKRHSSMGRSTAESDGFDQ
jgi:hypothetical protein